MASEGAVALARVSFGRWVGVRGGTLRDWDLEDILEGIEIRSR